jgi:hypothetical protein
MSEQGDPDPADKILGADWHPPLRDLVAKAWAEHPERERLEGPPRPGTRRAVPVLRRSASLERAGEGCANSVSCREVVFVDEAAEPDAPLDGGGRWVHGTDGLLGRLGWREIQ